MFNKSIYYEFKNKEMASKWGKEHYGHWTEVYNKNTYYLKKLIPEWEFEAIQYYCGGDYRFINGLLRNIDLGIKDVNTYKLLTVTLINLITFAPKIPQDIVLFRIPSDRFIRQLNLDIEEKGYTIEKGFLSTSLIESITSSTQYYGNKNYLLKIYVKKGTPGIYTSLVKNADFREEEQEMLLLPNSCLKLVKEPYKNKGRTIYECELKDYAKLYL